MTTPNPFRRGSVMPAVPAHLVRRPQEPDSSPRGRIRDALNRTHAMEPRTKVDLRKLREALSLTPQYVAALAGITDMTLLRCEDRQDDRRMIEEILAVYALYMATRWGADLLNLTEKNLAEDDHR